MKLNRIFLVLIFPIFASPVFAQKTWADVITILTTNCGSNSCHGSGSSNQSFNVDTNSAILYTQIVNADPINPYAKDSVNNKTVDPGSPKTSFLMRKIAGCTIGSLKIVLEEGKTMPDGGAPALSEADIELIYQWILQGASETAVISPDTVEGNVCDIYASLPSIKADEVAFSVINSMSDSKITVAYTLKSFSDVTIDLFDASGRNIKTLFTDRQTSGRHVEAFETEVSSGIFFVRLTVNGASFTKKIARN